MTRKNFTQVHCSVAQCLAAVGDIWSFLIIRDAMTGVSRFSDFERGLGIAKNILRNRLASLVESEILMKVEAGQHGSRHEYRLTEKGKDLFPTLTALYQWSEKWVEEPNRSPFEICDRKLGKPIRRLQVEDAEGNPLKLDDIMASPKVTSD